ncbi:MAG: metallophosphoesterase, partial [Brevundimonas sp.]
MKTTQALMLGAALAALGGQTMAQTAERPLRPEPAPVQASDRPVAPPTEQPERRILNLTADPAPAMAITGRTAPGAVGYVEYAEAQDGPDFIQQAVRAAAVTDDATITVREAAEFRAAYHATVLKGLKPETV